MVASTPTQNGGVHQRSTVALKATRKHRTAPKAPRRVKMFLMFMVHLWFAPWTRANPREPATPAPAGMPRHRQPESLEEFREAFAYAVGSDERFVNPAHKNYQVRLGRFLRARGVEPTWEENFVDLRFKIAQRHYIGEIKLTGSLSADEAFRAALGQLLDYMPTPSLYHRTESSYALTFGSTRVAWRCLALATPLGLSVIWESSESRYWFLNPSIDSEPAQVFQESRPSGSARST